MDDDARPKSSAENRRLVALIFLTLVEPQLGQHTLEGICLRSAAASTFRSCSGLLNPHTLQVGSLPEFVTPHSGHFQSGITLSSAGIWAVFSAPYLSPL